jgi:D-alanine-D-alanine ligase
MRIGIAFDLKGDDALADPSSVPDDFQEEFDSPATIEAIGAALNDLGHEVVFLGDGRAMLERVLADPPDLVFNMAEGHGVSRCREARVPAVLEMLGIPCTGSDPLTLAVTLDKDCAKRLVAAEGVAVAPGFVIGADDDPRDNVGRLVFPVIAKPAWEGSSKGISNKCLVRTPGELTDVVKALRREQKQPILVEEFIQGDELTVGMVGNDPPEIIGIMRVIPKHPVEEFVYSLEIKRDFRRLVNYEVPAQLVAAATQAVARAAHAAFRALGCRDVSRVDFRLRQGVPYFLEVNPLPGLNPDDSDLVIMAKLLGWTYSQLIERILSAAVDRQRLLRRDSHPHVPALARPTPR